MKDAVRAKPRLNVSSVAAGIAVARQGWGLVRVLSYQVGPYLADGTLMSVLDPYEPEPLPIHLVHVDGRRVPAKVRAFIDFAKPRLRQVPALQ